MHRAILKIFLLLLMFPLLGLAQNPSKWSLDSDAKGKSLKASETFKVDLKAEIEAGGICTRSNSPKAGRSRRQ